MTIWFSSDFHFNHTNICGPKVSKWDKGYRHFDSVDMNNTIIDNLNSKIGANDELYFLGDFAFGDKKQIPSLRERINCRNIFYLLGNHDHALVKYYGSCFNWLDKYYELTYKGTLFCCFHYPIASWNEMGKGSINVFGHCHNNFSTRGRQEDVGVDAGDFYPTSADEVLERMLKIDYKSFSVDHHR